MGLNQIAKFDGCQKSYLWVSHDELHRFMKCLYFKEKLEPENGVKIFLKKEYIENLREVIENSFMPMMTAFMSPHDFSDLNILRYKSQDLEFCDWALANLDNNKKIYYTFWSD